MAKNKIRSRKFSKLTKTLRSKTKKTAASLRHRTTETYHSLRISFLNLDLGSLSKVGTSIVEKALQISQQTRTRTEAVLLGVEFESVLDKLIILKKSDPEVRLVDESKDATLARIKRKAVMILKLYNTELEILATAAVLPRRYFKYFAYLIVAIDLFGLAKVKPEPAQPPTT